MIRMGRRVALKNVDSGEKILIGRILPEKTSAIQGDRIHLPQEAKSDGHDHRRNCQQND